VHAAAVVQVLYFIKYKPAAVSCRYRAAAFDSVCLEAQ
jgi:hypothetical protein